MTRRAALMESQVDVLEGKQRALKRYRDSLAGRVGGVRGLPGSGRFARRSDRWRMGSAASVPGGVADSIGSLPPAVSPILLDAQEDMRREIARAMHDGPAQSLTNIVLQAQIVERLVSKDPAKANAEVQLARRRWSSRRSMPRSRSSSRSARWSSTTWGSSRRSGGRRAIVAGEAGVPVEFESMGQDRRLPMDLESGLFRILDEALTGYLEARAEQITFKLEWSADQLDATMSAARAAATGPPRAVRRHRPARTCRRRSRR